MQEDHQEITLLTVKETAKLLNVKENWLRQAAREGKIPSIKLVRRVYFDRREILIWLDHHRRKGG